MLVEAAQKAAAHLDERGSAAGRQIEPAEQFEARRAAGALQAQESCR